MNVATPWVIGLLFFIVFVAIMFNAFKYTDPFDVGKNSARKALPEISKALGVEYVPSEDSEGLGGLAGSYKGFRVSISPDDTSVIDVELNQSVKIHLSNAKPERSHLNEGMDAFDFQGEVANQLFTTRFASHALVEKLEKSQEIVDFANTYSKSWGKQISRLECDSSIVSVRFKHGMSSYIPAKDIEPMLNDLVAFATILESL